MNITCSLRYSLEFWEMLKFLLNPEKNVSSQIAKSQGTLIHMSFYKEIYESENILALGE